MINILHLTNMMLIMLPTNRRAASHRAAAAKLPAKTSFAAVRSRVRKNVAEHQPAGAQPVRLSGGEAAAAAEASAEQGQPALVSRSEHAAELAQANFKRSGSQSEAPQLNRYVRS